LIRAEHKGLDRDINETPEQPRSITRSWRCDKIVSELYGMILQGLKLTVRSGVSYIGFRTRCGPAKNTFGQHGPDFE